MDVTLKTDSKNNIPKFVTLKDNTLTPQILPEKNFAFGFQPRGICILGVGEKCNDNAFNLK